MAHTPKPWTTRKSSSGGLVLLRGTWENHPQSSIQINPEDDAILMSAAPDMFDALEDIVEQAERTRIMLPADLSDSIRVFGKAALAKARGEQP